MSNIRWKGHFDTTENWIYNAGVPQRPEYAADYLAQSNGEYSTWVATTNLVEWENQTARWNGIVELPTEGQVDFQVQALIGYSSYVTEQFIGPYAYFNFTGTSSNWSNSQILTIKQTASSPPSSTPTVPEISIIWLVLLAETFPAIVLYLKKRLMFSSHTHEGTP